MKEYIELVLKPNIYGYEAKTKSFNNYQKIINSINELNSLQKELDKLMNYFDIEELTNEERDRIKLYLKAINCAIVISKREINKFRDSIFGKEGE